LSPVALTDHPLGLGAAFGDKTVPSDEAVEDAPDEDVKDIEEHRKTSEVLTS
jgi:hypothetical protein